MRKVSTICNDASTEAEKKKEIVDKVQDIANDFEEYEDKLDKLRN